MAAQNRLRSHTGVAGGVVPPPGPHGGDGPAVARALELEPESMLDLSQTMDQYASDVAALVRDCTSFAMPGWLRVAVPDSSGLDRLASAIDGLLGGTGDLGAGVGR